MEEPSQKPEENEVESNNFVNTINDICNGAVADEAGVALQKVVKDVQTFGGEGWVNVRVKVKKRAEDRVEVAGIVTESRPKAQPIPSIRFIGEQGSLHREDQRQGQLKLQEQGPTVTVRQPDQATA